MIGVPSLWMLARSSQKGSLNSSAAGDGNEVAGSYVCALGLKNAPSVIACSRTSMPVQVGTSVANVAKGAYPLAPVACAALIIAATGSELDLAVQVWPLGAWDILPVLWVRVANGCQPWPIAQSVA